MNDISTEASLILSGWQRQQADPVFSFYWVHGTWTEMGYFANADRAKQASDCGKWIALDDGCWRSEDGRRLIEPERVIAKRGISAARRSSQEHEAA